jgi:hypothetical protein
MRILFSILSVLLCLYSCSGGNGIIEEPAIEKPTNPKEYIVSLGFSGEITNIEESPLSRAVTNDLYGIQVYSKPSSGGEYKPYAYGLFDDKANMNIKLLEGYKYKFECTMAVNGKNRIKKINNGYVTPFVLENSSAYPSTMLNFIYSTSIKYSQIQYGNTYLEQENKIFSRPNIDRYYGEYLDYVPTDGGSVSIKMKRVVFGAKFIAEGLIDGQLDITIDDAPTISIISGTAYEVQEIFTFSNGNYNYKWTQDDYYEIIPVSILWKKTDGAIIPLVSQDITFKRNKLTTITVKVKDNSINNGVDVSQENTPMGDGGNITIDTSNGTDTGVTPNS